MIGDVARITQWMGQPVNPPAWAVIQDDDPVQPGIIFVIAPSNNDSWEEGDYSLLDHGDDEWQVVDEDDLPDEVHVAIAKTALLRRM